MKIKKIEDTTAGLRLDYLMAASYYYYKAIGADENLVSAVNRMKATELAKQLGEHTPTPKEVWAYAVGRWSVHKLHQERLHEER